MKKAVVSCVIFCISLLSFYLYSVGDYQYFVDLNRNGDKYIGIIEKVNEIRRTRPRQENTIIHYYIRTNDGIYNKVFEYAPTKVVSIQFLELRFLPSHYEGQQIEVITPNNNLDVSFPQDFVDYQIRNFYRDIVIRTCIIQAIWFLYLLGLEKNQKSKRKAIFLFYKDMSYKEHYIRKMEHADIYDSIIKDINEDFFKRTLIEYIYRFGQKEMHICKSGESYMVKDDNNEVEYYDTKESMAQKLRDKINQEEI